MKPNHISHPLRQIKLEHKNEEPLSAFEASAVKEYVRLHDVTYDLLRRRDAMAGEELRLELWLQKCDDGFPAVEQEIIKCGPAAGYTWEELDKLGLTQGEVDLGYVTQIVDEYQDKVVEWIEAAKAFYETYLQWRDDSLDGLDDVSKFRREYYNEISYKNEDKTIERMSFLIDLQAFTKIMDAVTDAESPFLKSYTEYIAKQNAFIAKVNIIFDRANKVAAVADETIKSQRNAGFGMN